MRLILIAAEMRSSSTLCADELQLFPLKRAHHDPCRFGFLGMPGVVHKTLQEHCPKTFLIAEDFSHGFPCKFPISDFPAHRLAEIHAGRLSAVSDGKSHLVSRIGYRSNCLAP